MSRAYTKDDSCWVWKENDSVHQASQHLLAVRVPASFLNFRHSLESQGTKNERWNGKIYQGFLLCVSKILCTSLRPFRNRTLKSDIYTNHLSPALQFVLFLGEVCAVEQTSSSLFSPKLCPVFAPLAVSVLPRPRPENL